MSVSPQATASAFDALLVTPVTLVMRVAGPSPDDNGEQTFTEELFETTCYMQQEGAHEDNEATVLVDFWRFWLPGETAELAPRGWDLLRVPGAGDFELEGDPWPVQNPRAGGAVHHLEVRARRVQ